MLCLWLASQRGTWALGIGWIAFCVASKVVAFVYEQNYGVRETPSGGIVSFRNIFRLRFCTLEAVGMMIEPELYADVPFQPTLREEINAIGVDVAWRGNQLATRLTRRGQTLKVTNGLRDVENSRRRPPSPTVPLEAPVDGHQNDNDQNDDDNDNSAISSQDN